MSVRLVFVCASCEWAYRKHMLEATDKHLYQCIRKCCSLSANRDIICGFSRNKYWFRFACIKIRASSAWDAEYENGIFFTVKFSLKGLNNVPCILHIVEKFWVFHILIKRKLWGVDLFVECHSAFRVGVWMYQGVSRAFKYFCWCLCVLANRNLVCRLYVNMEIYPSLKNKSGLYAWHMKIRCHKFWQNSHSKFRIYQWYCLETYLKSIFRPSL